MKKCNIPKNFLIQEYSKNEKSQKQIAKEIDCGIKTIAKYLKKHNIRIRTNSEAHKGKLHNNYIDGRTLKIYYCIDCGKEISLSNGVYGKGRCHSCELKRRYQLGIINNNGKNNGNYKEERHKSYYCKELGCNNKICYQTWKYGNKTCHQCAGKTRWKNEEYKKEQLKSSFEGRKIKPNKPEKLLNKILNKILLNEYKFVGDGKFWIGGFNPDFINCNGQKKIIELYGCYWHKCPKCGFGNKKIQSKDVERIKNYVQYGYKTLIVWEHELKDLEMLIAKIMEFKS